MSSWLTSWQPRLRRPLVRLRDDRGTAMGPEILLATAFLVGLFVFVCQVVVWWHARNILEQAAAEGARMAAAADASCAAAAPAATVLAERMGGDWVDGLTIRCTDAGGGAGGTVRVTVSASTPAFLLPADLGVSATATAPKEGPVS